MKKTLLLIALATVCLFGCNPHEEPNLGDKNDTIPHNQIDTIPQQHIDTFEYCLTDASWICNWLKDKRFYGMKNDIPNCPTIEGDTVYLLCNHYEIVTFYTNGTAEHYQLTTYKGYDKTFTNENGYDYYHYFNMTFPEYKEFFPFVQLPSMFNPETGEIYEYEGMKFEITSDTTLLYYGCDVYIKSDTIFVPKRESDNTKTQPCNLHPISL